LEKRAAVYILASRKYGLLYIGVTSDFATRIWQHRNDILPGETKRQAIHRLVYYEAYDDIYEAVQRHKQIQAWSQSWKIKLIDNFNPHWQDLWDSISGTCVRTDPEHFSV